jgi:8-oxo-dGTP diphosphatase
MTAPLPDLPEVCVCYILRETASGGYEVLLGEKKKGLGLGKIVGPGGKLEPGESPVQAVVREVLEESGLRVREDNLTALGRIRYEFPHRPAWSQTSWVFSTFDWHGEIVESDELLLRWHPVDDIPFDRMWDDARHWLPTALNGEYCERRFVFGPDLSTVVAGDLPVTPARRG